MSSSKLNKYNYNWPYFNPSEDNHWIHNKETNSFVRQMPEDAKELALDSRWPGFFPSAICFVTTIDGEITALEKVVGASIVNRFPYIVALSFCTKPISKRHYARNKFNETLEKGGQVSIHYFEPGENIDKVMNSINTIDDSETERRISETNLSTRKAVSNDSPVFEDAYLVYEARLVKPGTDFEGNKIFDEPYTDFGSHRIYYLEIDAIQLREDIAFGKSQIYWQSLPHWKAKEENESRGFKAKVSKIDSAYQKGYTPNYYFPALNTIAFEYDKIENNMAVKLLPPLPEDQVEVDNDRARWPCFFPSSAGMITTWGKDGVPNLMPCGSTTVFVRHPLCIGICVSYAEINARYAPRATLDSLEKFGRFGCGIPFINDKVIEAIKYAGNVSVRHDKNKIENSGLEIIPDEWSPVLPALPIHFDCEVKKVVRLGTHFLYIGEVKAIRLREDISADNPLSWFPYADVLKSKVEV